MSMTDSEILTRMNEAETKAWKALARYKFYLFGYYAAQWVELNKATSFPLPNPFQRLVKEARRLFGGLPIA